MSFQANFKIGKKKKFPQILQVTKDKEHTCKRAKMLTSIQ